MSQFSLRYENGHVSIAYCTRIYYVRVLQHSATHLDKVYRYLLRCKFTADVQRQRISVCSPVDKEMVS